MTEHSSLSVAVGASIVASTEPGGLLVHSAAAGPVHAEPIGLHRKASAAQALIVIATSCLRQTALNRDGVRGGSSEALHQMRVGLRRLRAALSIFKSILRPGEVDDLKRELVWLTEQLTAAREYDVLVESNRKNDGAPRSLLGDEAELTRELKRRRHEAFAFARLAVASERFERLIVSSAIALISRGNEGGVGERPASHLARRVLQRRTRRVLLGLSEFGRLNPRERHELRIRVKKLRYGTEYFATLFPPLHGAQKRFGRALEDLQEVLGRLNDLAVERRIFETVIDECRLEARASRRMSFAMGAFARSEMAEEEQLVARVEKLRARLVHAPRFWR